MKTFLTFIILVIIAAAVFIAYFGIIIFSKNLVSSRAETMTKKYIANLYGEYKIVGLNCQGEDTDGDSYVSCDVRIRKEEDTTTEQTRYLNCPTIWKSFTGNTCKERPLLPGTN
jgi:flagellar basal body-associated protein FliL